MPKHIHDQIYVIYITRVNSVGVSKMFSILSLGALGPGSITGPQTTAPALRLGFVALFPLAVPSRNTGGSNQPWGSQGYSH